MSMRHRGDRYSRLSDVKMGVRHNFRNCGARASKIAEFNPCLNYVRHVKNSLSR